MIRYLINGGTWRSSAVAYSCTFIHGEGGTVADGFQPYSRDNDSGINVTINAIAHCDEMSNYL